MSFVWHEVRQQERLNGVFFIMADAKPDLSVVAGDAAENFRRAKLASGKEAAALYEAVFHDEDAGLKDREQSILALAGLYAELGQADQLAALLEKAKPLFLEIPKARTAKIVRTLIDYVAAVEGDTLVLQEKLCVDCIDWANAEKRRYDSPGIGWIDAFSFS